MNSIKEIRFEFDTDIVDKLAKVTAGYNLTPYIYSQCIFALLLHKYTGQQRFSIAYPVTIREGAHFIYGGQVNLNLITYDFTKVSTVVQLLDQVSTFFAATIKNESRPSYFSIADILQVSDNSDSLLQVLFTQAYFRDQSFSFAGIKKTETLHTLSVDGVTKNTLIFEQDPTRDKLNYRVKYDQKSVDTELLQAFINSYKKLFVDILEDLARDDNQKRLLADYSLLSAEQYQQLVYGFNQTAKSYPSTKTIHTLFAEQVSRTPNNIAIVCENAQLTYAELNAKANQLAHFLLTNYSICVEDLVVLCLDKNEHMVIAILAVLKTGAAYVPVEPNDPEKKIDEIIDETRTKVIITNDIYSSKFNKINANALSVDSKQFKDLVSQESTDDPSVVMTSENLAYVLYTSGSTGKSKGVLHQHNNVISLFSATNEICNFHAQDVWILFHAYIFDFTIWEMWGALLYGGKLIIPSPSEIQDPNLFYALCSKTKVTVITQTPQAFYHFVDVAIQQFISNPLTFLRFVFVGGEKLNFSVLRHWLKIYKNPETKLINLYGPTEIVVFATMKLVTDKDLGGNSLIGTAISDKKIYILNDLMQPMPTGSTGELFIGGKGLARGYLNDAARTKQHFIANPFQTTAEKLCNANSRLYKTGDLVRRLPSGDLEFIGRNDSQVKIRGYRIELGAIETFLIRFPGVTQAAAVVRTQSHDANVATKYIVAYYVAVHKLDESKITEYLARHLTSYMRPTIIMHVTNLPLTASGKLNTRALPTPTFSRCTSYIPASNTKEQLVCKAFSSVLGINPIGVTDDFFNLGGDSLKAIKLTYLLQAFFSVKVTDIFGLCTPQNIAKHARLEGSVLTQRLNKVKQTYAQEKSIQQRITTEIKQQEDLYLSAIQNFTFDPTLTKSVTNVLLTGATGYLGCNLLYQLLELTDYRIFVIVRSNTKQKAIDRIRQKFEFYFGNDLAAAITKRVVILKGDLELPRLGLTKEIYNELSIKIDSIIHAAALTKHYGEAEKFHAANVQATIYLLELAKLTKSKDFHYISTTSVLNFPTSPTKTAYIGTENDMPEELLASNNIYVKTKLQAECQVVKYRSYGINSNIYRVGNLTVHSKNCRLQENLHENAFANWLYGLLSMPYIASEISTVEMSPVDLTARAIVKLFDRKELANGVYHVFNPNQVDLTEVFLELKTVSIDEFIDYIAKQLLDNNVSNNESLLKFALRQGWVEDIDNQLATAKLLQTKTANILQQLNFKWAVITKKQLKAYLEQYKKA